jgi:hypothetical protein
LYLSYRYPEPPWLVKRKGRHIRSLFAEDEIISFIFELSLNEGILQDEDTLKAKWGLVDDR